MDAENGPRCDCGRPSEYESGICGYCAETFVSERQLKEHDERIDRLDKELEEKRKQRG